MNESGWALIMLVIYFMPTLVAWMRTKENVGSIFIWNLFLAWTVIGWFVVLFWAIMKPKKIYFTIYKT